VLRYCEGCRCSHELEAFDEANALCRAYSRKQKRSPRAGARQLSKIETLEQRRRGLIAALVQIDQKIARERALLGQPPLVTQHTADDVSGSDSEPR